MKLLRVGCAALLLLALVAAHDTARDEGGALLTPLHPEDDARDWRGGKAMTGGGMEAAASLEEDLVYGDDVLPSRTRPRNKRRRRKRLRQQRPLPPPDYGDLADGDGGGDVTPYRPRLRPRLRPRPPFETDSISDTVEVASFADTPTPNTDDRPTPVRPRVGGGRRRKPQRFHDTEDTDVADKPGPPFSDVDEEEYVTPRRRPYPRKQDRFPDDETGPNDYKPQHEEEPYLLPQTKPYHLPEEEHDKYLAPPAEDNLEFIPHRTRKGPRRQNNHNLPSEISIKHYDFPSPNDEDIYTPDAGLQDRVRKPVAAKHPDKFASNAEIPENIRPSMDPDDEFKKPSRQKALKEDEMPNATTQREIDDTHQTQPNKELTLENSKELPMPETEQTKQNEWDSPLVTPKGESHPVPAHNSSRNKAKDSMEIIKQDNVPLEHDQSKNKAQESLKLDTAPVAQQRKANEPHHQITKQGQRRPYLPQLADNNSKPYVPRLDNTKHYMPQSEETSSKQPDPPLNLKPITVSLDELLKLKNITLDEVLKKDEEQSQLHITTQSPGRALQGPLRRLPSASEFFAKRKNISQTLQQTANSNEEIKPDIKETNQATTEPPPNSRPRESRRKYGNDANKQFGTNRFSIKEVITTTTSTTQEPVTSTSTTTTQHKPMPLNMQESSVIDPINIGFEDDSNDQQLTSHDRELAKQLLKNRISEANNSSKVHEFLQSNGIRLPPITVVIPRNRSTPEVTEVYHKGQVFDVELELGDRPVRQKIPFGASNDPEPSSTKSKPRDEILDLLQTETGSARLARILATRNMTLAELIEHRERGASHQHISDIFPQDATDIPAPTTPDPERTNNIKIKDETSSKEMSSTFTNIEDMFNMFKHSHEALEQSRNIHKGLNTKHEPKVPTLISIVNPLIYSQNNFQETKQVQSPLSESNYQRDPRVLDGSSLNQEQNSFNPGRRKPLPPTFHQSHNSFDYDLPYRTISPLPLTSTTKSLRDGIEGLVIVDNIGQVKEVDGNDIQSSYDTIAVDGEDIHQPEELIEDGTQRSSNILPTAVKSAIIASAAIFGLAIVVFLAIFVMCKWRQKRTRRRFANEVLSTRARSPILNETLQHDMRHAKRSLSPVLVHRGGTYKESGLPDSDTYVEPRRYYLWRTIRKTLRYK